MYGGKTHTIECPLVGSKGDKLVVNHGLIASANISKVTFGTDCFQPGELKWPGMGPLRIIPSMQKATFMPYIHSTYIHT